MMLIFVIFHQKNPMNTQAEISWIAKELERSNDPAIIKYFKSFLLSRAQKPEAASISVEQYNKEINEAEAQIVAGNYVTQEDLEREAETW
jgi:hypothetical protein